MALTSYRRQFSGSSLALRNVGAREAVLPGSGHGVPSGSVSYTELADEFVVPYVLEKLFARQQLTHVSFDQSVAA